MQAADQKKCFSDQIASKPESHGGLAPQRSPGPQALRRRVRRVGAAAAHSAPQPQHDCSAAQTARRCGGAHASAGCPTRTTRIRTPRTTPGTRLHPVTSALLANSEVAPETAVPCGRAATAATA